MESNNRSEDLMPGYMDSETASRYSTFTKRKLGLFIKYDMLKFAKVGKGYIFRKEWLDEFMEEWNGWDLGTEEKIRFAVESRKWNERHGG